MGVPELLKFAAKAPGSLTRIRQHGTSHVFDYVMIDGTNVMQTIGVDAVVTLLSSSAITVTEGIFVLLDSQRDRAGTAREQRSHLSSHTIDVGAQQLCSAMANVAKAKSVKVYVSGRDVEGEADYKILHLHRGLATAAKTQNRPIPKFLFISEDSDVLAGCLCGPAPNSCWIATRLRDATQTLCLLSIEIVTHWLTGVGKVDIAQQEAPEAKAIESDDANVVGHEEVVESRHKKDGPMVGMGTATYFADSDDEDNASEKVPTRSAVATLAVATASAGHKERAQRQQSAGVDLILLFLLLKGCGYLAPVIKGATKVDMSSIWASYMHLGRSIVAFEGNSIRFDGAGLAKVLQSSHLFDSMSRPANNEEIASARKYLVAVSKTLVRSIVAFRGPRGAPDLVDGRSDQIVEPPTLAAFYALLDQPDQTRVPMSVLFPPMTKPVANPIEESMMLLSDSTARPTPAPHALPTIKVGIVNTLSTSSISDLVELFLEVTLREALTTTPEIDSENTAAAAGSAFSFDLRRMVAVDAPAKKQSLSAVLAAAGLSTGYSYAIDPAKVLARSRPNMKPQPAAPVTPADFATPQSATEVIVPIHSQAPASLPKPPVAVGKKETGSANSRPPRVPPTRVMKDESKKSSGDAAAPVTNDAKAARKGKKRLGKKERVMLAKKMGKQANTAGNGSQPAE